MILGVDLDNTIISYDKAFYQVALKQKLISPDMPRSKEVIKQYLIRFHGSNVWTGLQGLVYGKYIMKAEPFPGVVVFLTECHKRNIDFYIISHKTRHPIIGPKINLRQSAIEWLEKHNFFSVNGCNMPYKNIFFCATLTEKIEQIKKCACTHFIDDLVEVFQQPGFPSTTSRILFGRPNSRVLSLNPMKNLSRWDKINQVFSLLNGNVQK